MTMRRPLDVHKIALMFHSQLNAFQFRCASMTSKSIKIINWTLDMNAGAEGRTEDDCSIVIRN